MININYNSKKKEISALVQLGHQILEFPEAPGISTFFCIQSFDPSSASSTASIDFNRMDKAIDINDFLANTTMAVNVVDFNNKFTQYIEREPKLNIKFSAEVQWKLYYR